MAQPILLYGSEIWGSENVSNLEMLQNQFMKFLLSVKKSTSFNLLYGKLGRYPVSLDVKLIMVTLWEKVILEHAKISFLIYQLLLNDYNNVTCENKWLKFIKSIFDEAGYSNVAYGRHSMIRDHINLLKLISSVRLHDKCLQT